VRSIINCTLHRYGEANRRILATFRFNTEMINYWVSELSELGQCSGLLSHRIPLKEFPLMGIYQRNTLIEMCENDY
jgi:hypothetical protein